MTPVILDGTKMTTECGAHDHIAEMLRFPDYYGHNLDALADCLWEVPKDVCVILMDSEAMLSALGKYGRRLISIFEENAERANGCGFVICGDEADDN
ncbi:MAG: barstar family protein [Clostridia bacterium]|nr:barstar family protein [Clostridia bacterium]